MTHYLMLINFPTSIIDVLARNPVTWDFRREQIERDVKCKEWADV